MHAKTKTYTIPEKNFLRQAGRGMWVGSEFKDHGKTMMVTTVGKAYTNDKEWLIDIEAVETSSEKK